VVTQGPDVTVFDRWAAHRYEGDPLRKTVGDVFDDETVAHARQASRLFWLSWAGQQL